MLLELECLFIKINFYVSLMSRLGTYIGGYQMDL